MKRKLQIACIFLLLVSCNGKKPVAIQQQKIRQLWINKTIILPNKLDTISSAEYLMPQAEKELKLINLINGSCSGCINQLKKWELNLNAQLMFEHLEIKHIVYSDFEVFLENRINNELRIPFTVLLDKEDEIRSKNNFYHNLFGTFLIDSENKIICIADPFNKKDLKLLKKVIKEHEPE